MITPSEKLAASLIVLKKLQEDGNVAIRSSNLARTHRERLLKNGFLQEVMKGWYITTNPSEREGDSTAWYTSFWSFCSSYLYERFGANWCLSPEQSLLLHVANRTVPKQLLVRSTKANNSVTQLPYATSILEICANQPASHIIVQDGLRIYSIQYALISCTISFYQQNPTDARAALTMIRDASEILELLLEGGHTRGALQNGTKSF